VITHDAHDVNGDMVFLRGPGYRIGEDLVHHLGWQKGVLLVVTTPREEVGIFV
jgi:hypothetical protein